MTRPAELNPGEGRLQLTRRWRVLAALVRTLRRLAAWRIDVEGIEHLPARSGAVLAFNHHSYVDFVMLAWGVVIVAGRPVRFLGKQELWSSRMVGWAPRWVDAIPVDRTSAQGRVAAFDRAVAALEAGDLVAVAPEQTISASLELLPFRAGAVRMAQRAGVPVIPVIGWGTHRAARPGTRLRAKRRLPVTVRFGEPFQVAPDADPVAATDELRSRMSAMLIDVMESYPDGAPAGARWVPASRGGSAPPHDEAVRAHRERFGTTGGPEAASGG